MSEEPLQLDYATNKIYELLTEHGELSARRISAATGFPLIHVQILLNQRKCFGINTLTGNYGLRSIENEENPEK